MSNITHLQQRAEIKGCPIADQAKAAFQDSKDKRELAWTAFVNARAAHEAAWQAIGGWGVRSDDDRLQAEWLARTEAHEGHELAKAVMVRKRITWHCAVTDHYAGRHEGCRQSRQEDK